MLTLFSLALTVLPRTVTALPQPDAARYGFTSVEDPTVERKRAAIARSDS